MPSEFQKALPVLEKIERSRLLRLYFVGGSVRDALLNRPIHDVDIADVFLSRRNQADFSANSRYRNRAWNCLGLRWDEGEWGDHFSDRGCLCGLSQTQCGLLCALKKKTPSAVISQSMPLPWRDRRNHWLVPWFRRFESKSYEQLEWLVSVSTKMFYGLCVVSVFRLVLALSLSQKRLKLWRLWRHFGENFCGAYLRWVW